MRVLTVSVTSRGAAIAERLPYEHVHGKAGESVRSNWDQVDALVLVLAVGAAVRVVAPLLSHKSSDPAVVCVDDDGRYAVALCGGHASPGDGPGTGANSLARTVARLTGAEAVVSTSSDSAGLPALDDLVGLHAEGDVAAVTRAMLDGEDVTVENELGWPLPAALERPEGPSGRRQPGAGGPRVVVTDRQIPSGPRTVLLRPPSLVVGIGAATGAPEGEMLALVRRALESAGLARPSVHELATVDRRQDEPAIRGLPWPVRAFTTEELAAVEVPHPSPVVERAIGTPSVAEAAALLVAGPGGSLVAAKLKSSHATVAIARRRRPRGRLSIVGLGPGSPEQRTPAAESAIRRAEMVVGYGPYVDSCADLLSCSQDVVRSPIGSEIERAKLAVSAAAAGRRVALVCSGDPGVYAMASPALEVAASTPEPPDVEVVPGITASLSAAAALGAPLGHDHASVSLSDLLTPWAEIERRLLAVAEADLVVSLYNPRSSRRTWQLDAAREIFLRYRDRQTPVGVVTDAGRGDQRRVITTLGKLDTSSVTMSSLVIVGSSGTREAAGRMCTARGYEEGEL
jgi:cobalt-precorrin 5A hydrolase / cobalt-factor III methyltransferase / precorrin-3B C17-methyltransferase